MSDTLARLKCLAEMNLAEFLKAVQDPKRELLDRMKELRDELEEGRKEVAQQGSAVGDYESAELELSEQIAFEGRMAAKAVDDPESAKAHIRKQMELEKQLETAQTETKKFKEPLDELNATVDAVAQQLGALEKAYGVIEMMGSKTQMLSALNKIAETHEQAEALMREEKINALTEQNLAELRGTALPTKPDEAEVERRLAGLKKPKSKGKKE